MAQNPVPLFTFLTGNPPEPPPELGAFGAELWRSIVREWKSTAPEHKRCCYKLAKLPIVRKACAGKSRPLASSSRRPGAAIKANPLIMLEIAARALVARLLGRLGVLDSGEKDALGRPPKLGR